MPRTFRIFGQGDLGNDFLDRFFQQVRPIINDYSEAQILSGDESAMIESVVSSLAVSVPHLDFENKYVSPLEKTIYAKDLPSESYVRSKGPFQASAIIFRYPIQGDSEILQFQPLNGYGWSEECYIEDGDLCFDVLTRGRSAQNLRQDWEQTESYLKANYESIKYQVDAHRKRVRQTAEQFIHERRATINRRNEYVAALGIPLKRNPNLPPTFPIPSPIHKRKLKPATVADPIGSTPDPTLEERDYDYILQIIHDAGQVIEQHPSLRQGKDEEALRDLFLFQLAPRFEGSTTSETFNAAGKTDILMKYHGANVFVAECKFWRGPSALLDVGKRRGAISQLLSYLTWRDSKTALILFVDNKGFSDVIQTAVQAVSGHPNYLRCTGQRGATWFDFRMHFDGDKRREIHLALMLFHLRGQW